MKIASGFFKFIAYALMVIFIIFMPLSLFARSVGQSLYDPAKFLEMVKEDVLNAEIMANFVEEFILENVEFQQNQGDNLFANVLLQGVLNLDHDDWVTIVNFVTPPEIISGAFDQVLDSYYRWIDGRNSMPLIQVDLIPWKNSIADNTIPILEIIMRDIRACNPDEIELYNRIRYSGNYDEIPPCRPPEPNYSWILETGASEAPEFLTTLPDQLDNSRALSLSTRDPDEFKQSYLRLVSVMRAGWIILAILFIIAIPLGARSIPDIFKWIGWPLMIAGIWGLLISILLMFFTEGIMALIGGLALGSAPPVVLNQFETMGVALVKFFQRPLMVQSAAIFGLGCVSLLIGFMLGRNQPRKITSSPQPAPVPPKTAVKEDNDDTPTGMFG
jgi:hypothetical protein